MSETSDKTVAPQPPIPSDSAPLRRRRRGRGACLAGLAIGTLGLAASRLGQLWVAFDVFSQFTLQFAILTIAFLFGLLMPRAKVLMALVILVAGVVGIGLWPHYVSRSPPVYDAAKPGEREIRVASFNTWYDNQRIDEVEAEIARLDADVIVLIEFGPNKRQIASRLASRYPYLAECFSIDYCHMAILSKFPIAGTEARVNWEGAPMIRATLGPELGGLTVFGVHMIRFPHSRAQYRQAAALSKLIDTTPGRKVVMGDFNATPFSRITRTIAQQAGLRLLTELPTWPSRLELPQMAIDHIFASPGIRVTEGQTIGNGAGSDHYPVTLKLAVPLN